MAPRRELARREGYTYLTARERQFLDAHTGAGVNVRRSSAAGGRDGGQVRDIYRPRYHNNQRQHRGRGGASARGRRPVERPTLNDGRHHHNQAQGTQGRAAEVNLPRARGQPQARIDRDNVAGSDATKNSHEQGAFTLMDRNPVTPEMDINVNKRSANPVTPNSNTRPIQQLASFSCPQFTQFTESRPEFPSLFLPGTPSPGRPRELPSGSFSDTEFDMPALPPPPERPVRPYRGKDEVKRAFTNANLRAIMADKPYPKPKGKVGAEKPILKMGIRKGYK